MKKRILMIILLLLIPLKINEVSAIVISSCKISVLSELKSVASNINLSYTYEIRNNNAYFKVTINNLNNKFYIIDNLGNKFYYNNSNNGEIITNEYSNIEKIKYSIYSNIPECMNDLLTTKYINLPTYNIYYTDPLCKGMEDYKICQKWYKQTLDYDEFVIKVNKYKNVHKELEEVKKETVSTKGLFDILFDVYINYYYIILPIIIIICLSFMYIKNRKNRFKL